MFRHIVLAVLMFYCNSHSTKAYPRIYIKEIYDTNNRLYDNFRTELIKKGYELLQKQNELNLIGINNCLQTYIKMQNKLNCIKRFIAQNKYHERGGSKLPHGPHSNDDRIIYDDFTDISQRENPENIKNMSFSQDYLDIKDLLRSKSGSQKKKKFVFQIVNPTERHTENMPNFNNFRKFYANKIDNKNLRISSDESSESSGSEEIPQKEKRQESSESESELSNNAEVTTRKPKTKNGKLLYIQSPTHFYRPSRRRLPHFLPKRYHWDEEDIKKLHDYWFSGPQGKYWGPYKTPY
ncbi:unnamed protein product, partial [Brenthis ino]